MGADSPSSLAAIIASRRAAFLSYREAMNKLAAHTGDPLRAIAEALKIFSLHENHLACLTDVERRVERLDDPAGMTQLLDWTIETGELPTRLETWDLQEVTPDTFGWMRANFVTLLRAHHPSACPDSLEIAPMDERAALSPHQGALIIDDPTAEVERLNREIERLQTEVEELKDGLSFVDDENFPPELAECLRVWRVASRRWASSIDKKPKAVVEEVIAEMLPNLGRSSNEFKRYSAVCNWDKARHRK